MSKPVLFVFSISHYCEKARWALEHAKIAYKLRPIAPGFHTKAAKKLGLRRGALPFLSIDKKPVQGSAAILDWIETQPGKEHLFTPQALEAECREFETRLDDLLGVHARRYYYSEAILKHPGTVLPIFKKDLPAIEHFVVSRKWDMICGLMTKGMDLGPDQGQASRDIIISEMDWLDGLLADGRQYLVGSQFTRADIAAAALLAPLAMPDEHPEYDGTFLPPGVAADKKGWESRPCFDYVRRIYKDHR